jgi:hypothetical protein
MKRFSIALRIVSFCALLVILFSCAKKKESIADEATINSTAQKTNERAVCIIEGASLWKEPGKGKNNWLSSLSLGETIEWLGESKLDSTDNNREYVKVGLSDGTAGWVSSYCVIKGAEAGAIKEETPIYKRPDILTITPKKLSPMAVVAVLQIKDDLSEIVGENQKNNGWVKSEMITKDKEDVTVAILANKKFKENPKTPKETLIKEIIETSPYPNSFFINSLKKEIDMDDGAVSTTNVINSESATDEAAGE